MLFYEYDVDGSIVCSCVLCEVLVDEEVCVEQLYGVEVDISDVVERVGDVELVVGVSVLQQF